MGDRSHPDARVRPQLGLPDRYEAVRHIASGGMASVWCARDRALGRNVAIKLLAERFADDPAGSERFTREARAAARLSGHPNVVMIYDVGETDESAGAPGRAFIVMEYLAGGTVADALRVDSVRRVHTVKWIHEAAAAVDYGHERGVLHRDIKPANLLLDRDRVLHVADFGIARLGTEDTITGTGQVLGTASYLAPERALGRPATEASDRYSLAVAAYELLVGERPFTSAHFAAQARQHVEDEPPRRERAQPCPAAGGRCGPGPRDGQAARAALAERARFRPGDRGGTDRAGDEDVSRRRRSCGCEGCGRGCGCRGGGWRRACRADRAASAPGRLWPASPSDGRARAGDGGYGCLEPAPAPIPRRPRAGAGRAGGRRGGGRRGSGDDRQRRLERDAFRGRRNAAGGLGRHASATNRRRHRPSSRPPRTRRATVTATPAAATTPAPLAETLEARGHQLMVDGNYGAAIPVLQQAVTAASPGSLTYAYALYDLGRSLRLAGDPADAAKVLYQRLQIPNQTGTVRAQLQLALLALGDKARSGGAGAGPGPRAG